MHWYMLAGCVISDHEEKIPYFYTAEWGSCISIDLTSISNLNFNRLTCKPLKKKDV